MPRLVSARWPMPFSGNTRVASRLNGLKIHQMGAHLSNQAGRSVPGTALTRHDRALWQNSALMVGPSWIQTLAC